MCSLASLSSGKGPCMPRNPDSPPAVLLSSIEQVLGLSVAAARERYDWLTPRERQVAALMAAGKLNRDIANDLGITIKTLDVHRNTIKIKLIARTGAEIANCVNLVRLAELVEPSE